MLVLDIDIPSYVEKRLKSWEAYVSLNLVKRWLENKRETEKVESKSAWNLSTLKEKRKKNVHIFHWATTIKLTLRICSLLDFVQNTIFFILTVRIVDTYFELREIDFALQLCFLGFFFFICKLSYLVVWLGVSTILCIWLRLICTLVDYSEAIYLICTTRDFTLTLRGFSC